ncbi:MAG: diacylglycerol kinase family lipid kinase [Bacteroidota bacterium]|nr:diacylglycerol kinase family lipid kinase [Bacteroidota bacterium]
MKEKILFIINPVSGIGKQKTVEQAIETHLDKKKYNYNIAYTQYPHHATTISKEAVQEGYSIVVAVGGDGSINDCVRGLINTKIKLGIIPAGSGNGLARCLHIPLEVTKAIEVINLNNNLRIDTINLNDRPYASVAGVGFDALIAKEFTGSKIRGFQTYLKLVLKDYLNYKPKKYTLIVDGIEIEREALFISFMNSNQFGYNAIIAPKASLNDGLLDVVVVKKPPIILAPFVVQMMFFHKMDKSPYVETFRAKEVEVKNFEDGILNLDGEGIEYKEKSLKFCVEPNDLNVIVPDKKNKQPFLSEKKILDLIKSIIYELPKKEE